MKFINHLFFFFLVSFLSQNTFAQENLAAELLAKADSLFTSNKIEEAKETYKKVLKMDNNNLKAKGALGQIAYIQNDWSEVKGQFDAVLKINPNHLEANYFRGIAYRETGKFKALLMRKLDWNKAKNHFEKVVAQDSAFSDVLYQYGILERYKNEYEEAIKLGHKQIQLKPELPNAQLGLFKFYNFFIKHSDMDRAINWLKNQKWDHAKYYIAEKKRIEQNFEDAKSVLEKLTKQTLSIPKQPIYLSLTKIYYQQNKPDVAQYYYQKAINEIQDQLGADLIFEDLKYIVNDSEYEKYQSLKYPFEFKEFFRNFWLKRDPLPAAKINKRLEEHYRRFLYAENNYEFDGFRTWFNNPDKLTYFSYPKSYSLNEEFNDKGLIFIRQGKADDWVITAGELVQSNESWQYYETQVNPEMTFHFFKENAPGNNWRLSPSITNPRMLEDRFEFGNEYFRLYRSNELERMSIIDQMAQKSVEAASFAFTHDRHTWKKEIEPLELPFSLVTFKGKFNKTSVELYYSIPTKYFNTDVPDSSWSETLESGITLHDLQWHEVEFQAKDSPLIKPPTEFKAWLDVYKFDVKPDSYHVAFHVRPKNSDLLGGYKFDKKINDYSSSDIAISDILLAEQIQPNDSQSNSQFVKNELKIIPNPGGQFLKTQPVFLYYELYNLTLNSNKKTSFTVEHTLKLEQKDSSGLKKIFGLFKGKSKSSISITSEREGSSELSPEYLGIDVSKLDPGQYSLRVKVTDKNSLQTVTQRTKLRLVK